MTAGPKVGDELTVSLCTSADGDLIRDARVKVAYRCQLGCGCVRLEVNRPGSGDTRSMHLHFPGCEFHRSNPIDGTTTFTTAQPKATT